MDRSTRILIGAALAALLTLGIGFAGSKYSEKELKNLIQTCEAEGERSRATAKHKWQQGPLICDPETLKSLGDNTGLQAQIVDTQQKAHTWLRKSRLLALLIVGIGALPYAWYFLLRRLRELRAAAAGK